MPEKIKAPFSPEQVAALNRYQFGGWAHPFTCPEDHIQDHSSDYQGWVIHDHARLIAFEDGWRCPMQWCNYKQSWAWEAMLHDGKPPWWPEGETG